MPAPGLAHGGRAISSGRDLGDGPEPVTKWENPPETLSLGLDEVHVWRASLNLEASRLHALLPTLADDERARAARFHFPRDRDHFIAGRGILRAILARYLKTPPADLRFRYGALGKPSLAEECGGARHRFNVSHSYGLALYAVALDRELGVDLELVQPRQAERIAERFFSPREVAVLRALPAEQQETAFFACWTRKEAYIKAKGDGLYLGLDQFDVSLSPNEPAALLRTAGDPTEAARWSLAALDVAPGYAAALCVEGHDWRLACWQRDSAGEHP